jgi:hypothetical protein
VIAIEERMNVQRIEQVVVQLHREERALRAFLAVEPSLSHKGFAT